MATSAPARASSSQPQSRLNDDGGATWAPPIVVHPGFNRLPLTADTTTGAARAGTGRAGPRHGAVCGTRDREGVAGSVGGRGDRVRRGRSGGGRQRRRGRVAQRALGGLEVCDARAGIATVVVGSKRLRRSLGGAGL